MLNKIKENKIIILGLLLIIALIFYFVLREEEKTTILKDNIKETQLCFFDKSESQTKKGKYNVNYIEIDQSKKPIISGKIIDIYPGEKPLKATFIGAFDKNILNIITTTEGEGLKEQKIYFFNGKEIKPADYIEKKVVEGVRMVPDISKVTFNGKYSIKKVNCQGINKEDINF
jgi:hypothetical protein